MNVLVIGGDKLVYFLSRSLMGRGHRVTIVNRNPDESRRLARRLENATVVLGDGSAPDVLEEAGAYQADAVLAVTPNDEDNLVICQTASVRFEVPRTLALVNDPDHEETFRRLGVAAVSPTHVLSRLLEQQMGFDDIEQLIPIGEGNLNVTELVLDADSPVIGLPLSEIGLPQDALIAALLRRGKPIIPRGTAVLRERDHIVVVTLPESHHVALARLTGDSDV
ncbi:MAG: TrkA family potassium uptake protein [Armatimonadia bacterium]|nr:TrkA family potassium uptake protein [Armatimonadia bacterium]